MIASEKGYSSCISLLLSHGANVNDKDDKVSTSTNMYLSYSILYNVLFHSVYFPIS